MTTPYFTTRLKTELSKRQRTNRTYSLRAFARDLDVHPSTLSSVMNGRRPLPLDDAERVARILSLNLKERAFFLESITRRKLSLDRLEIKKDSAADQFLLNEAHYQVIAEWEHYALLNLISCEDFESSAEFVAKRLNISEKRANEVIEKLLQCGLLKKNSRGQFERTHARLKTTEDVSSPAIQASHEEMLAIAKEKLVKLETEARDFSSLTFAMGTGDIDDLKILIREFREKINEYLRTRPKQEVFQLNLQLFPLTQPKTTLKKPSTRRKATSHAKI